MHGIDTKCNDPVLLALSTMKLNVDDDFMPRLKAAYFSCSCFFDKNELRHRIHNIVKSSEYRYRHRQRVDPVSPSCCDSPSGKSFNKEGIAT